MPHGATGGYEGGCRNPAKPGERNLKQKKEDEKTKRRMRKKEKREEEETCCGGGRTETGI